MPSVLLKSEPISVEVGGQVYWVNLQTRRVSKSGSEPVFQYWAFLPPGTRPAVLRGKDRDEILVQIRETVTRQFSGPAQ